MAQIAALAIVAKALAEDGIDGYNMAGLQEAIRVNLVAQIRTFPLTLQESLYLRIENLSNGL